MTSSAADWETVVGLEIHVQLLTKSKLFSPAPVRFGQPANVDVDAVDAGLPGALPVLNEMAVACALRLGLALQAQIARRSQFARKHYFYPDLPKGFQISQAERPIIENGTVSVLLEDGSERAIHIERAHLEEDAGKSLHGEAGTGLDWNRSGTPLLEVVTTPELRSGDEAMRLFRTLRALVMHLGICDGNLQEGSMRADANVSVRRRGEPLGIRVELKNLNSPRFLCDAVEHEARRQRELLLSGAAVTRETRLWDPDRSQSRVMRSKEDAPDYRYMPDPDLPPIVVDDALLARTKASLPELPVAKRRRYLDVLGLPEAIVTTLVDDDPSLALLFEGALSSWSAQPRVLANWIVNELLGIEGGRSLSPARLAHVVRLVDEGVISGRSGKELLREAVQSSDDVGSIVEARGFRLQKDPAAAEKLQAAIAEVFAAHADQVAKVLAGKDKVKGFLVGQVLKRLGAGLDPKDVGAAVDAALAARR